MTAAQTLIWRAAGTPPIEGAKGKLLKPQPGICAITGEHFDTTADAKRALGENFTDHSLWSTHTGRVGPAALWCCSGKTSQNPLDRLHERRVTMIGFASTPAGRALVLVVGVWIVAKTMLPASKGLWFAFMLPTTASLTISALLSGGWV